MFNRETAFKEVRIITLEIAQISSGGIANGLNKGVVFGLIHRTVDIIAFFFITAIIATGFEGNGHVNGFSRDNGRNSIVEVQIFEAPEYSVRMPVSPAGEIAIPYAGLFHVAGMTSIEASQAIARLFVQNQILRDPRVIVTTQQFGYSVTVMGEVKTPGIYNLAGRKRLIDLLTEAGGVGQFAKQNSIYILRVVNGKTEKIPFRYKDAVLGKGNGGDVELLPNDRVVVP